MQRVRSSVGSTRSDDTTGRARPAGYARRKALQVAGAALASGLATAMGPRLVGAAAAGQPGVHFPETGHTVALDFAQFWLDNGGQNLFGLPITSEYIEDGVGIQWFERARFERWPGQPGIVLPLLADEYLAVTGRSPTTYPSVAVTDLALTDPGQYFSRKRVYGTWAVSELLPPIWWHSHLRPSDQRGAPRGRCPSAVFSACSPGATPRWSPSRAARRRTSATAWVAAGDIAATA